jgi:lipopolysaccharide/colanic/teichoic acid biosynthesis glycosyltransferase
MCKNKLKRIFDLTVSGFFIIPLSVFLIPFLFLILLEDYGTPFYISKRAGKEGRPFKIVKLRTMVKDADKNNILSTKKGDKRITKIGKIIRKFKIDELSQIYNVFKGEMSFVGPRPNTYKWGVNLYTNKEKELLKIKPGITDFSSIIFSDENVILQNSINPDEDYNLIIRPWKSRFGLLYLEKNNFIVDISLILITLIAILNKLLALKLLVFLLRKINASKVLIKVAKREDEIPIIEPPI